MEEIILYGIAIPPLLVFLTEFIKPIFEKYKWVKVLFPFLLGCLISYIQFEALTPQFLIFGLFYGALATGEYKGVVKNLKIKK